MEDRAPQRTVRVKRYRQARRYTQRDPLATDDPWDFDEYKLHPLWGDKDPELAIRVGNHLYRGTSTVYTSKGVKAHEWPPHVSIPKWMKENFEYMAEEGEEPRPAYYQVSEFIGRRPVRVRRHVRTLK